MAEIVFDRDQWNVQRNESKPGVSCLEAESAYEAASGDPRLR